MILELRDVRKSYLQAKEKIPVLSGVNLKILTGQKLAIVGHSGCGKSTLLSVVAGLDRVDSGSILFQGQDLSSSTQDQLTEWRAHNLSIIFQQFHLMRHLTALENISLPLDAFTSNSRYSAVM